MKARSDLQIILASSSPRRHDLLRAAGIPFSKVVPEVVEKREDNEGPEEYADRNSRNKCQWVCDNLPNDLRTSPGIVISADTIVVLGQDVLEKPNDIDHAIEMLHRLSGRTHQVMTGFSLMSVNNGELVKVSRVVKTDVTFRDLSDSEIRRYVASGEPMDKAGAYGAQGGASHLIRHINGSYTNVIGLPVAEVLDEMKLHFPSYALR